VGVLSQRPELLDLLLRALGHPGLSQPLEARDSTLRVANPLEVRPDVVLLGEGERGAWMIVEVQLARDDDKRRRWLSAAAMLLDARGAMGDLAVITHDASVAAWASEVARDIGPNGTQLVLAPVVVTLTLAEAHRLLTSERGELAMFAAWAVHDQRGGEARARLTVLSARGLVVDPVARERIERCDDTGQLTRWVARAVTAASVDEVFAEAEVASGET